MNLAARFVIVSGCLVLCAGGIALVNPTCYRTATVEDEAEMAGTLVWSDAYQLAAGDVPEFDLKQIETAILLHDTIKSGCNRVEFGAVKIEHGTAQVEVFFFSSDQRMLPFLYKLISENHSWKIVSVERMWSVSRSGVVRGLRV